VRILVSDLHLGKGDDLDDFLLGFKGDNSTIPKCIREMDEKFGHFLKFLSGQSQASNPVKLILLGDIFDLIQVTAHKGTGKLAAIYNAHKAFFQQLSEFAGNHCVIYVVGNHDAEMLDPAMAEWLKKKVPNLQLDQKGLPFLFYQENELYCEHGNQLEGLPRYNVIRDIYRDFSSQPFTANDYPVGSRFVLDLVNDLESKYPDVDNVLGDRRAATTYYLIKTKTDTVFLKFVEKLVKLRAKLHIASASPHDEALVLLSQLTGRPADLANAQRDATALELLRLLQRYLGTKQGLKSANARQAAVRFIELLKENTGWLVQQMRGWAKNIDENAARFLHNPGAPAGLLQQPHSAKVRFIVCGHTHCTTTILSDDKQRKYLNSGTWRHFYEPVTKAYSQTLHYVLLDEGKAELHHFA
jgi:UDP-2,3-diacylglucosamine pyrophosphatase LpxH